MAHIRREIRLESTEFPCEALEISKLEGIERISQLFSFELHLELHDEAAFSAKDMMAANASLVFIEDDVESRRVHGMIAEVVDELESESGRTSFRVRFVPRAFRLTLVKLQEVFLDTALPQIIEKKLGLVGLAEDFELRLAEEKLYAEREFIVQYDETDLAFVSRLLEHVGINFYFEHGDGRDKIVFCDRNTGFGVAPNDGRVAYYPRGDKRGVYRMEARFSAVPSAYIVSDYNYETPLVDLAASCELSDGYGGGVIEFGTNLRDEAEASALARVRAEAHGATTTVFEGESAQSFSGGMRMIVEGHPRLGAIELLVVEAKHSYVRRPNDESGGHYANTFKAIPAETPYRAPRVTPKPRIHGVLSGVVDAAPGVDTVTPWIDEHGRYLVRVFFDTAPPGERKASLPIRMAQAHSGANYGVHFPLRPGTEVLLVFVGGDPDRPIIVGSVPNMVTPTPVTNRDATYHRIRTASGVLVEIDDGF
jgi:type VI secretion system secreted protein VgrG